MLSNYDRMKRQMQGEFLKYDQSQMARHFQLDMDEDWLSFPFMGGDCRIDRHTGRVECGENGSFREADYNEAMTVYDLLCWSKSEAAPSGIFVPMQSLSGIHSASASSSSGFFNRQRSRYDHRESALRSALEGLGGKIVDGGDVTAELDVFSGLKVLFRFWNSDEDFEPEIQFLWDRNVLLYMHYETVWFANHALIDRIDRGMTDERQ